MRALVPINDTDAEQPVAELLQQLGDIWRRSHRRRDLLAFIRACPKEQWALLSEEYDKLVNQG